ncbi:MAG TPA: translation initiation factor IF-2, partial [Balneola sp.]|nr:translation initiation factor IF-2 [Balneola sp.]
MRKTKHMTLDDLSRRLALGEVSELNIIIKADVDGSIEALSGSLQKISNDEVAVNIIHTGAGAISESDVLLASASDAIIIGFQVRPTQQARKLAETEEIDIRLFSVIYDAVDEVRDA